MWDREFIQELKTAIKDLLWFSEAEYPFKIFYQRSANNFNQKTLLQHYNYPLETRITIQKFNSFFASVVVTEAWHNESEKAEIKRYQYLMNLMTENLSNIKVYLLGEVEIDVYILGETKHKAIAGITTKTVST